MSTMIAIVCGVIGLVFSAVALGNLAPSVSFFDTAAMGPLAGRERFTQRGWLFRNMALVSVGIAIVIFGAKVVFGG